MKNKELVELLIQKNYKISCAESCTGGMLASTIVDVPAASQVIDMSFVTYANEAKVKLVDVLESTIETYGVVSEEVAREMAFGCAKKANAQIGVGISGIAGPTGATKTKPIGMVCFGFFINGKLYSETKLFGSIGRMDVRLASVDFVLDFLLNKLKN
ncbi:MAG: CinA family protein [Anaeroplasmataceae bacterium]|nr:CinA family protein [Anaeroplasmataceae bacterium]